MPNAELREQCVDSADLDTGLPTCIAQGGRTDVVFAVRLEQRQSCEALDDLRAGLGASEALQEFLQHKARGDDHL